MKKFVCAALVLLCAFGGFRARALSVSGEAAALISGDTGEVLFEKNANSRMPMASTTKIMTALLLCEHGELDREIKVTEEMTRVEGSSMGLLPGDTVSLRALLYGLLLASGNDAANTVAIVLGGSAAGFAEMMNNRAAELGLKDTHFVTPSGLDSEEHYTTALELALLAREAMKNETFAAAAATPYEVVYYGNPPYKRGLKNHNRLLNEFDGAVGVKTGFTKRSGRCLVSAAKRDGKYVIAVTLNAPDDWNDHRSMLEYGLSVVRSVSLSPPQTNSVRCIGGSQNEVRLKSEAFSVTTAAEDGITVKLRLPRFVYAPVRAGEVIGTAEYYSGDKLIGSADICCENAVSERETAFFERFAAAFKDILANF